ncbi:MAG: adenylate/guanylate cyclase domain-containing protein [Xanthobacteraceae bacterium]
MNARGPDEGNVSNERFDRALTAFLRQEIQAPASAITDFLDMIIEDASESQSTGFLADLDRMRSAGLQLNAFVKTLIQDSPSDRREDENSEAFHRRLRHDLRTPLNAIKGYSELLIEDMPKDGDHPLRADLARLKAAADQLLGQIEAMVVLARGESKSPGEADNTLQFDIVAQALHALQPLAATTAAIAEPSRILIVDDNAANRDVLERRLSREGHDVASAANGAAALQLAVDREFDLILLDLIMPGMSGFELLGRLKAAQHTRHVPVIVISALDELDSAVRCIESGAEDYLIKPINPTLLRARIGASLDRKRLRDREKKFTADLEEEKERYQSLLLNILPQPVVTRIRNGELMIADQIMEATILFCDVVGFTALSQQLVPARTIDFLSRIFSAFDRLAAELKVEKIKTIGDAYMVAAGIPEAQPDHAERIATLAPRMLDAVAEVGKATELNLQARIGVHTGPIIAGVIGTHKFAYDVWGDTVNTASRMESHSLPGRIQLSAATRAVLGDRFDIERRGLIEVKGKGIMETFFLNGR